MIRMRTRNTDSENWKCENNAKGPKTMRTMAEIAELLHDAGSHAAGWERILRKRAEAPDTVQKT